jgi:CheY-like chemotaxis protein
MAQTMVEVFGGRMEANASPQPKDTFRAEIHLPLAEQVPVLVVDDNNDTLLLFRRYLTGTRYQFFSARDPDQALALAQEISPGVIVMDILLPGIDGWELLGRMRAHPLTRKIPVVTCTISPEEQLALALGSAAFLRKPVSREALLQTLDHLMDQRVIKRI